ncbi:MAG: efflux RND transporter periplasmic adaptor subunit [Spirochaetota bacterium]
MNENDRFPAHSRGTGPQNAGAAAFPRRAASIRQAVGLAALLAAPLALLGSCAKPKEIMVRPPRAVQAETASLKPFFLEAEYAARILPASQVNVTPKVGGRVAKVFVRVGDFVEKNQKLFTIEPGDFEAQFRQAKASLLSARANLSRNEGSGQESQMLQAQSAYDQALIQRDEIQKAWDKTKRLYDGGVVPKQQFDDVDAKLRAANLQLEAAKKSLTLVRDKSGQQASQVLVGQVDAAEAQADLAKSQLDSAAVLSPLAGHVSWSDVEPGAMIGTNTLAFVVIDDSSVLAEAGLTDRAIGYVRKGMSLKVSIPALRGAAAERVGTVDRVSPAADLRTMLYTVRVAISNDDGAIRPGMLAKIRFPIEALRQALLVPERATYTENGLDYVMVAEEGRAHRKQVSLGESSGSLVEVREGLADGALVITAGQEVLSDGDRILASP